MRTVKETMHQAVEVIYKKVDTAPAHDWKLTFFQLVYIVSGTGILNINGNSIPYQTGNLLLLTPDDCHHFNITSPTEFILIRFNNHHIREYRWDNIDHIECLLYYASHLSGCIIQCRTDQYLVKRIMASILHGIQYQNVYTTDLNTHLVNALIVIAARNIARIRPANLRANADSRIREIIGHIQLHIRYPEQLKAVTIAKKFGLSQTYLGSYFKNQCGETIQQYITAYKTRLIEHRLKFSDRRINEIVDEFGFADESHLNKFFKKQRGVSLTAYRKQAI